MIRSTNIARRTGFTLLETALATIIVAVGIVATMQLFAACTFQNNASAQMSSAMMAATNIQEAMGGLTFADPGVGHTHFGSETGETLATYNDIDDFNGKTFSPPIDSLRQQVPELSQFTQVVSVWPVNPGKLSINSDTSSPDVPQTTYTGAARVTVRVLYAATPSDVASEIYRASWIRMDN